MSVIFDVVELNSDVCHLSLVSEVPFHVGTYNHQGCLCYQILFKVNQRNDLYDMTLCHQLNYSR